MKISNKINKLGILLLSTLTIASSFAGGNSSDREIVWKATSIPFTQGYSITYSGSRFIAVGNESFSAYSNDGINWDTTRVPSFALLRSVACNGDTCIATAGSTNSAKSYNSGSSWQTMTMPNGSYVSIAYGNGTFVAVNGTERYLC